MISPQPFDRKNRSRHYITPLRKSRFSTNIVEGERRRSSFDNNRLLNYTLEAVQLDGLGIVTKELISYILVYSR